MLQFEYKAPGSAGDIDINAECFNGKTCTQQGPKQVWVGVKYLHPATDSPNYVLITPNKDTAHPDNHYLTGAANAALEELAIRYHLEYPNSPALYLNDSSLKRGGVFDISYGCPRTASSCSTRPIAWWIKPHGEHRRGVVIDVDSTSMPPQHYGRFKDIANGLYMNVGDETKQRNHFHVRLLGLFQ